MSGRTILKVENPVTQSLAAIKALLSWKGRASDPLPQFVEIGKEESRLVLILSNKRDAYYTCTARACSCPGNQFRHNCKHQRRFFPQETARPAATTEPGSIRPAAGWIGPDGQRANGPVEA